MNFSPSFNPIELPFANGGFLPIVTTSFKLVCSKVIRAVKTLVVDAGKWVSSPFLEYNISPVLASIKIAALEFKIGNKNTIFPVYFL